MSGSIVTLSRIFVRKARNFAKDPIGTTKNQPHRIRAATSKWHLERNGLIDVVREFQRLRPGDAFTGDPGDWWFLYKKIRERHPKLVLEFGSGSSTVVQAQALLDNRDGGRLISIDASPLWAASTQSCMPEHLKSIVEVIHGPLVEVEEYGVKGWRHQNVPRIAPNFVYLDGPELTSERQVAVDLLDMEDSFPPGFFLVIDDRKANTRFLREHFRRRYKFDSRTYRGTNPTFELIG
jgi:hypothetical protein